MLKYKEKTAFTYNIQHEAKCGQSGCCTIAASFPFEPRDKCMTFNDIFPGP